jgi:hypothetical protein
MCDGEIIRALNDNPSLGKNKIAIQSFPWEIKIVK